jgi:hypothetical protein
MHIPFSKCYELLKMRNITVNGIFHVGAHKCEELEDYQKCGVDKSNIYWVDADEDKVDIAKMRGIPNVFYAALDNKEEVVMFNVTNNGQSSSLLNLGTHKTNYPDIVVVENRPLTTQTGINFVRRNNIPIALCNFWNLDIQGKELDVIKSMEHLIQYADAIYCEINIEEVYEGCGLLSEVDAYLNLYRFTRVETHMTNEGWGDAFYIRKI